MVNIKKILTSSNVTLFKLILKIANVVGLKVMTDNENYIVCYSNKKVLTLCSHWDTVLPQPKNIAQCNGFIFSGIGLGADDRAGIYIMLSLMEQYKDAFHYAFFNYEECGSIGANIFCKDNAKLPFKTGAFIGLDRRGSKHFVNYDRGNKKLESLFIAQGFKEEKGSTSDCKVLSVCYSKAMINLSVGFNKEHTEQEYLDLKSMNYTLETIKLFTNHSTEYGVETPKPVFKYDWYKY